MSMNRREFLTAASFAAASAICRSSQSAQTEPSSLTQFRNRFSGTIILPGDTNYDRARMIASFNPRTDKHPGLIARCLNADDVVRALEFARKQSLEIAVRAGGHDLLGASVCEGGIVIDVSQMKSISVDRERQMARVDAGVRSRDLNAATSSSGLAAVLGCNPAVGVAGLTLGGGLGWFLGKFGAACDNLLAAQVITADGKILRASADDNADLFWALRGGGGNFGIVTNLEYRLHPVVNILGGVIAFRGDLQSFLRFYRDFMKTAPDELAIEMSIIVLDVPVILCTVCWSGDLAEGERVLRPLSSFGPPVADEIHAVSYEHLTDRPGAEFGAKVFGAPPTVPPAPGLTYDYWRGGSLKELNDQAIAQIMAAVGEASRGMSVGIGHYMHGQICRVHDDATALPRTAGQFTYFFDANWRNVERAEVAMAWVNKSWSAMQLFSSAGTYVNYLSNDSEDAVRASYRANYQKLAALKRKYDPSNVFHLNRNIRPSL
jgi:FAD/FMN-containing dehydrogenase